MKAFAPKYRVFFAELRQPNASPVLRGRWRGRAGGGRFYAAFLLAKKHFTQLAEAIDAKDAYTKGHSGRVAAFSREIARRYGYPTGASGKSI